MKYQLPDAGDPVVDQSGSLREQARLYLLQLGKLISGQVFVKLPRYANLADLQNKIPNPEIDVEYGIVTGQGKTIWNGAAWVLSSDDTTVIV